NNWFWNFIVARFTEQMFSSWGFGVYFFFASLMILSTVFVFFFIPETKSIPLECMDRLFELGPTWRAHEKLMAELAQEGVGSESDGKDSNGKSAAGVDEQEEKRVEA